MNVWEKFSSGCVRIKGLGHGKTSAYTNVISCLFGSDKSAIAAKIVHKSNHCCLSSAIPELVRCSMFIIEFKAKNAGRWNAHQHLFIVSDQVGERQADAPNVMLNVGSVPLQDWVQILEKGWGAIRKPHLSFA